MKIAIISVSHKGQKLAEELKSKLDSDSTVIKCDLYHKNVKNTFSILFNDYDAVIAIMALGILIRSVSPLIESKATDPAVINIDDNGNFVISALSGHLGGSNELTGKIASLINAVPVITTSSDVNRKLGIDVIAHDLYLTIDNTKEILYFNKAILEEKTISFKVNSHKNLEYLYEYLENNTLEINLSIHHSSQIPVDEIHAEIDEHKLVLKEKPIVAGIGCKKGKESQYIEEALKKSVSDLKIPLSRVNMLASAEIKKDEKGILDLSRKLEIPVNFIEIDSLKSFKSDDISKSEFVYSKFGIYGVCEPSALIAAGSNSKLIYKKTAYDGITVAVAVKN